MHNNVILILILTVAIIGAKEVRRPAFIVDGEPFPQGLTISFDQSVDLEKSHRSLLIDATPLVINKTDNFQFFGMLGLMGERYGDSLQLKSIPESYLGAYVATNISGAFGNKFLFQSYHSLGGFGADADLFKSDALKYFHVSTVGKKWKPNFLTSVGLLTASRHGSPLFLPLLKVTYAHEKFVVDVIAPVSGKFRYLFSSNFNAVAYYKSSTTGFASFNDINATQRMSNQIGVTFERRIKGWFWAKAGALYDTGSEYTTESSEYETALHKTDGELRYLLELFVRPD